MGHAPTGHPFPNVAYGQAIQRFPYSPSDSILCLTASPRPLRVAAMITLQLLAALVVFFRYPSMPFSLATRPDS
jgi:hypothetical protein